MADGMGSRHPFLYVSQSILSDAESGDIYYNASSRTPIRVAACTDHYDGLVQGGASGYSISPAAPRAIIALC